MKGQDVNLLETVYLSVSLPEKKVCIPRCARLVTVCQVFSPMLNLRVFDDRAIGGKVLVGAASVDLAPYLDWLK